jgi:hypothetical protein
MAVMHDRMNALPFSVGTKKKPTTSFFFFQKRSRNIECNVQGDVEGKIECIACKVWCRGPVNNQKTTNILHELLQ